MSSRFNVLLHGEADEAADLLSGDNPAPQFGEHPMVFELQAALTNALRRIASLERDVRPLG